MNLALNTPRWMTWTATLGLAALMLPALTTPARAQTYVTPNTPVFVPNASNSSSNTGSSGPIPFSWLQFKQTFGLPGAPTVPQYPSYIPNGTLLQNQAGSGNQNAYNTAAGNPYLTPDVGNEYPGDYIRAYLLGDYGLIEPPGGFNNFFDEILGQDSGVVGWTAPDVNYSASSVTPIICDDDNALNISSVTGGTPVTTTTTITGFATPLPSGGWAQLTAATAGQIPTDINNYNGDSYYRTLAIPRQENPNPNIFFHWYPAVTTPGAYTVYAWFPSQNATTTSPDQAHEERHVTDARYQILIKGVVVQTATVDQQSGGTWVQIGGPFNFPLQAQAAYTTGGTPNQPTGLVNPTVEIRLDNTSGTLNTQNANYDVVPTDPNSAPYVVADAIELRGEDGSTTRMLSSPVAVNKMDYPELFSGYTTTNYPDYSGVGGLDPEYAQAHLVNSPINGSTGTVDATNTDVFTGIYANGASTGTVKGKLTNTAGGSILPIDQLVYFTRTETITSPTDPTAVQTVGAVYCVDGRNGNVVWRYPASNPVVINDTDTTVTPPATVANFTETGGTLETSATAYPPPVGGQYYQIAAGNAGGGVFATWNFPTPATGTITTNLYQVYVWVPSPATGETRVTNAVYTINGISGTATTANCISDQTTGGAWMPLTDTSGNSTFSLTPGTSFVTLSSGVYSGNAPGGAVITANAVEFVPAGSIGTTDSTPAIVRNMRVLTRPGGGTTGGDVWETRTVVIVADNLGKVYALDAAGNQDGNDTLLDANGAPVSFDATGATMNPPAGGYVLPYTPTRYGTTRVYWIWQPNPNSQVGTTIYDDNADTTATAGQSLFTVGQGFTTSITTPVVGPPTVTNAYPPPNGTALTDLAVAKATAPTPPDYVTWSPLLPAGTSLCNVYVWYPIDTTATTTANYTVVDAANNKHVVPVNQSTNGDQWNLLGQYTLSATANPPGVPTGYETSTNTIVLDNTTANAADVGKTVYADAVRVDVISPSQLLTPLAFQMCSPTVSLAPTNYTLYGMATPTAGVPPTNDATIYIGNSNGVMYSLEGGGVYGLPPVKDIRRNISLDPNTPTVGVNWWFDFGGYSTGNANTNTTPAQLATLGTTYAPAYDPYDGPLDDPANPTVPDGLLYFTTFSPSLTTDDGPTNQGYLFAVDAKYGPFGDGGNTGGAYTATDPTTRVGTPKYNNTPIPYWTFPDKFGTLVTDPPAGTAQQPLSLGADHLVTSGLAPVTETGRTFPVVPPAAPVGDSAGSPIVYTASIAGGTGPLFNPGRRVYFAANDPTSDVSSGRVYGIDPTTGKLDPVGANSYPFIYPATLGINPTQLSTVPNPYGDPNLIAFNDPIALNDVYVGGDSAYNINAADVPNSFGAFTDQDASTGYFVSSSPVAAPITYLTNTANLPGTVTNLPTGAAGSTGAGITTAGQTVQMMYMADLTGLMHYIDLTGNPGSPNHSSPAVDLYKDVYDYQVGDTIISTPALVPNASGAGYTTPEPVPSTGNPPTGSNVGGALFVTTEGGDIVELEAFPTQDTAVSTTAVRLKDWTYAGPGGYSSPAVASFDSTNVLPGQTISLGDSEWIYVGGDQGTCYGFTPNNLSANGTAPGGSAPPAGAPGTFAPPTDLAPPNTVPPNRNFYTIVSATNPNPNGTTTSITFDSSQGPPLNPVFDWGQTAYIEIFGVDQPNPASASSQTPKAIRITFTIRPVGRVGRGLRTVNKVIDLQSAKNVYTVTTPGTGTMAWPPANTVLSTSTAAAAATGTIVGPNVAVYAYQLGDGTSDPQTPGPKVQISNVTEQVQYYDMSNPPKLMTATIQGTADAGSIIRTKQGTPGQANSLGATAAIDQGTFSTLNPLAVRGAARSIGDTSPAVPQVPGVFNYYNMTLTPQGRTTLGQLGPFAGVNNNPTGSGTGTMLAVSKNTSIFNTAQAAMNNGNSLLTYAPLGGTEYAYTDGTHMNAQFVSAQSSTLVQTQSPPQYQAVVVTDAGLVSHGTDTVGKTPATLVTPITVPDGVDPVALGGFPNNATPPSTSSGGDYGAALLNILDRSALGEINTPITRLRMNNPALQWNDNSETGNGAGAVINPLPWDQLPQAYYVSGRSTSPDYPDIGTANTSVELIPRQNVPPNYSAIVDGPTTGNTTTALGSDTYITAADATLAPCDKPTSLTDESTRPLFPNAALLHVAIPKYQPANLESYPQTEGGNAVLSTGTTGGTLVPGINHADTTNQVAANVAEGYIARGQIFIDTRGNGRRDRTMAYRSVQVWAGVPADTSTSIAETTIDIGSVPAGFGLYGTTGAGGTTVVPTNNNWSPLIPGTTSASPYASFFKPITVINDGNVNLMNVHLDQRITGVMQTSTGLVNDPTLPPYLTFQSDTVNDPYGLPYPQSLVPSSDYATAVADTVTGTPLLPLVRSNFDYLDPTATYSGGTWNDLPQFNTLLPNSLVVGTSGTLSVPGATLHKPRPGDPSGSVMTVPDTPHNNYPNINGSVNLANQPYNGRPVVSMAIPLGTPVGTYSSTLRAFEGYDPGSQQYQGPMYEGSFVTALGPWTAATAPAAPFGMLTYNTSTNQPVQTASDPGTTLRATVVETRLTDGVPLPVSSTTINPTTGVQTTLNTSAVLPMIDSAAATTNSNDIQPWAFYDKNAARATLLWVSGRGASSTALQQTDPYDLYGSSLTSLTVPTNLSATNGSWWSAPASLTFPTSGLPTGLSAEAATNPSVAQLGTSTAQAFWVENQTSASGQKSYVLETSPITYNGSAQPQVNNPPTTLVTRAQPIFGPREAYVYAGTTASLALSALTVSSGSLSTTTPTDPAPGNTPLVFWSTRVGGRSQILYWPAVKADPTAAGKVIVSSGVLSVPADLRSVANPTATARIVNVVINGTLTSVSVVDVTYTGVSAATGQSDVYTSRYLVNINGDTPPSATDVGAVTALTLTLVPQLPVTTLAANGYLPTEPTVTEQLVNDGQNGYQSRSTGWLRDPKAFELDALTEQTTQTTGNKPVVSGGTTLSLIPSTFFSYLQANPGQTTYPHSRAAVYDKSSGQWIFTVNWNDLNNFYGNTVLSGLTAGQVLTDQANLLAFIQWLYGSTSTTLANAPNLLLYTNPAAGTVRFGVPLPSGTTITTSTSGGVVTSTLFVGLQAQFNPQAQRVTFHNGANVASISFIDDALKTNAAPYSASNGVAGADVTTSRYWYIYRKTIAGNGNAAATSSVLYYKTRRLTVVLPTPLQLTVVAATPTASAYAYVAGLSVTANGTPITNQVDIDWSRGRLYFPDIYEGDQIGVSYTVTSGTTTTMYTSGTNLPYYSLAWMDEQQANDPAGATDQGEHVIPISNAVNESDPTAFLNPAASYTQATSTNQSAAHSVWLFWSSSRNANGTNGSGADIYWEAIDPRFEVVPGP